MAQTTKIRDRLLILTGFMLEQASCMLGLFALVADLERAVALVLILAVAGMVTVGLALVVTGALLYHRRRRQE